MDHSWRKKLIDYLGGDRLSRLERSLGRDPGNYVLDPRNAEKIPETDIEWLFRAIESGALTELPDGDFRMPRSGARERLYSHGSSKECPVRVGIWIEPVISIGAVSRLMWAYRWPAECIGLQTGNWGFDLTCYEPGSEKVVIQCEVKVLEREVDHMCQYFESQLNGTGSEDTGTTAQRKNWNKKLVELNSTRPKIFWALGPGGYEHVYRVERTGPLGELRLKKASSALLRHRPSL